MRKCRSNKVGFPISVIIQLSQVDSRSKQSLEMLRGFPEVLECYHVTGYDCYVIKAVLSSMFHLEEFTARLSAFGRTTTLVVLSTLVEGRIIDSRQIDR